MPRRAGPSTPSATCPTAVLANLQAKYHLDEPLWQQYLHYLDTLLHGDLGAVVPLRRLVGQRPGGGALPVSLAIGGVSMPIAFVLGVALGIARRAAPATAPSITG